MASSSSEMYFDSSDKDLELIRVNHDEAFLYVSQALSYEEQNEYELARNMYLSGLEKIRKALNVNSNEPHCIGLKWDNARKMQQKMAKTVQMIDNQLSKLAVNVENEIINNNKNVEAPPSYDEACQQDNLSLLRRFSCPVDTAKLNVQEKNNEISIVSDLYCIPNNVQIFFISSNGSVSTSSSQNSLHVYKFEDVNGQDITHPVAWLQVGDWIYPLVPGHSPALESGYGAFFFPDVAHGEGAFVGLILPSDVSLDERKKFKALLSDLTAFEEEKSLDKNKQLSSLPKESSVDTFAKGIVVGAEYLSAGLVKGASVAGNLIHKGATKVRERMSPDTQPATVDPYVQEGLRLTKSASDVALKASGFLVRKLGELTVALGKQIAPHLQKHGTGLMMKAFKTDADQAQSTVDGFLKIAAGGLQGFSTVYLGLEQAAKTLAYSLSSETVNIVGHKYGTEMGNAVENAVFAVGNLALTTHNVQALGIKSVAKKTAKDTGKAVLEDYIVEVDKNGKK